MKTFIVLLSLLAFALPTMAAAKQNKPFIGTPSTRTQLLSCEIVKSKYSGKVYQKGDKAILAMAPKWALCQAKEVAVKQPVQVTKTPAQIQLELEERNMALFGNPNGRVIVQQQPVTVPVPQGERLTTEDRAREIANEEITRRQAEALRQAEESARLRAEADRAAVQRAAEEERARMAEAERIAALPVISDVDMIIGGAGSPAGTFNFYRRTSSGNVPTRVRSASLRLVGSVNAADIREFRLTPIIPGVEGVAIVSGDVITVTFTGNESAFPAYFIVSPILNDSAKGKTFEVNISSADFVVSSNERVRNVTGYNQPTGYNYYVTIPVSEPSQEMSRILQAECLERFPGNGGNAFYGSPTALSNLPGCRVDRF